MRTTTRDNTQGPSSSLPLVFIELARLLEQRIQDGLRDHELSINQIIALVRIAHEPGVSRAELARRMRISPQAVGQLLTPLMAKGLVVRTETKPGLAMQLTGTEPGYLLARDAMREIGLVNNAITALFRPNLAQALDGATRHVLARLSPGVTPTTGGGRE